MNNAELIITLTLIKGLGRKTINKIIRQGELNHLKSSEIIDYLNNINLKIKGIITKDELRYANEIAKRTIQICNNEGIKITTLLDEDFPQKLKNIDDSPVAIYYKGNYDCLNDKGIAIIGSRNPSLHGVNVSYKISSILSQKNYIIVSGLANGCDTFAHIGALDTYGKTIAVMPCGLDMVYPSNNRNLFNRIINNNGCVISEYPPGQTVSKYRLVDRDRLQSALSEGIIVIESTVNGGSLHTVNYGFDQNKIVACYKHNQDYLNLKTVKGNIKLLQNEEVIPIYDTKSLDEFLKKVENFYKYKNLQIYKEKTEQIQFKFSN
ncbi:DNA-processing protein DprA [Intestinibacter bartlettii]|uniref:DNA-protecting protein DprA n=1 Tax=Intestinibacter bartlettii TaxID=261299 RepID=A0ABS6DUI2_9FIRM|nr:DNA-processing protein DprA [Intestinibacter bartlettii]MBU5335103.1 DNA-protecting protein DprA [Intestinibacter bartlettii]